MVSFGLLAIKPPVRNEQFIDDVSRLVGGKKARIMTQQGRMPAPALTWRAQNTPIYVICSSGGTLESASERKARHVSAASSAHAARGIRTF